MIGSFHPLANIFPLMEGAEFSSLVEDILVNGQREPIVLYEGLILDGRNRFRACMEVGCEPECRNYLGTDPLGYVISLNLNRRHLNESQRAMVAARIATMRQGARTDLASIEAKSQVAAAEKLNVSRSAVQRATAVQERGTPELVHAVDIGVVSVSAATEIATLSAKQQKEIVAKGERAILDQAKKIRSARGDKKRASRNAILMQASNFNAPLPARKYPIILADPPWQYDFSPSDDRSVENHYSTMAIEEICALGVPGIATQDAMLFLWAPPSFIKKGLLVLEAWGFELATSMVWVKDKIGTGIYVRQRHEYLLLGKRGQPITPRPGDQPDSVIIAPRGQHSEKPEVVYGIIERMYPGLPCVELFARSRRPGWDVWGNEATPVAA